MDAARNLACDPAHVQAMYERMLEHQQEWSADRGAALAIRRALEQADSSAIYECDDLLPAHAHSGYWGHCC